jgi:putative oxidoreductase
MRWIDQVREYVLALFRIVVGALFVCHGASSLFGVLGAKSTAPFASWPGWWAAAIQLVGGVFVVVGLFTRVAALICSGSMAYAYFVVHLPKGFFPLLNGGEAAAMFCWAFLLIVFVGPGVWAVDRVLRRSATSAQSTAGAAVVD